jgi:hypothetical protein
LARAGHTLLRGGLPSTLVKGLRVISFALRTGHERRLSANCGVRGAIRNDRFTCVPGQGGAFQKQRGDRDVEKTAFPATAASTAAIPR